MLDGGVEFYFVHEFVVRFLQVYFFHCHDETRVVPLSSLEHGREGACTDHLWFIDDVVSYALKVLAKNFIIFLKKLKKIWLCFLIIISELIYFNFLLIKRAFDTSFFLNYVKLFCFVQVLKDVLCNFMRFFL